MAPVMPGNVNGQPPMSMPPMISRSSDLSGMLGEGAPPGAMLHGPPPPGPPNQYALANMMNTGPPPGPPMHEREMLLPHGMPPMMPGPPQHVGPHPGIPMGRTGPGGNPSCFITPEAKFLDFNRRLLQRNDDCDNIWWDSTISDYFEDDAGLMVSFIEDGASKRYVIGRTLIPRYFRSIFESGVTDYYYTLRSYRESFHGNMIRIESEACQMVMTYSRLIPPAMVIVEGSLYLDFTPEESMRIRHWNFQVKNHREFMVRSIPNFNTNPEQLLRDMTNSLTANGIPKSTLSFFRISNILEPMQELMSRQKAYSLNPKDCLKTTLFQKWQRMVAPPSQQQKSDSNRQSNKRRKRKGSNANSDSASNRSSKRKQSPVPSIPTISQPGDVMIVGEPTLMGGEFGDEDERSITRLENTQYDSSAAIAVSAGVNTSIAGSGGGGPPLLPPHPSVRHASQGLMMGPGGPGGGQQSGMNMMPGPHSLSSVSPLHNPNMMNNPAAQPPVSQMENQQSHPDFKPNNSNDFRPNSASTPNSNTNNGSNVGMMNGPLNNLIKSEQRLNNCVQYPGGCSTPGTTKTSGGSLDQNSDDQASVKSSKTTSTANTTNATTGPPRPTSQGGNQASDKPGDILLNDHQRPISEPLPYISGPVFGANSNNNQNSNSKNLDKSKSSATNNVSINSINTDQTTTASDQ